MDDEEWVTCPYNRAHRVPSLRIQRHLVKCEAQYPPLAICPYNATHRMPHAQLVAHVEACPTRAVLCSAGRAQPARRPAAQPERPPAAQPAPRPSVKRDYMAKNDPDDEEWD